MKKVVLKLDEKTHVTISELSLIRLNAKFPNMFEGKESIDLNSFDSKTKADILYAVGNAEADMLGMICDEDYLREHYSIKDTYRNLMKDIINPVFERIKYMEKMETLTDKIRIDLITLMLTDIAAFNDYLHEYEKGPKQK
jgi:hypothetical protein